MPGDLRSEAFEGPKHLNTLVINSQIKFRSQLLEVLTLNKSALDFKFHLWVFKRKIYTHREKKLTGKKGW